MDTYSFLALPLAAFINKFVLHHTGEPGFGFFHLHPAPAQLKVPHETVLDSVPRGFGIAGKGRGGSNQRRRVLFVQLAEFFFEENSRQLAEAVLDPCVY